MYDERSPPFPSPLHPRLCGTLRGKVGPWHWLSGDRRSFAPVAAPCFLKPEQRRTPWQGYFISLHPSLLCLSQGGEKKNQQAERAKLFMFSAETFEFCRRRGGSAAVSRAVSPLCEELWRLWPACFLAYFGIVHVECDTPDFPGCLSNASHLYQ